MKVFLARFRLSRELVFLKGLELERLMYEVWGKVGLISDFGSQCTKVVEVCTKSHFK